MKRLRAVVVGLAVVGGTLVTAGGGVGAENGGSTLADVLLADSKRDNAQGFDRRWFDYDIVTQAVLLFPELVAAAQDPNQRLTVFLPNDFAFRRLVFDLSGQFPRSEQAVFEYVAGLGTETVKTVLTYHIVPLDPPISYHAALQSNGATLPTLQTGTIGVQVKKFFGFPYVQLADADPDAQDPIVVQPEVGGQLVNGYAHGIESVLRPIDL